MPGDPRRGPARGLYDIIVAGAGPAGLSAAYAARRLGLSCIVLERGRLAQTVCDYPAGKPLHSPTQDVELLWGELHSENPRFAGREELLEHYRSFALRQHRLQIHTRETVEAIEHVPQGLRVSSNRGCYEGKHVIVATGGFGIPRRLNVPGESDRRVSYRFTSGAPHAGREVLVVGGGNSAAEAALWLHEASAKVTLSLRRPSFAPRNGIIDAFTSVKPYNSERLEALAARGELRVLYRSQVLEITDEAALLQVDDRPERCIVRCSHIFALVGADPDVSLLRKAGAAIAADGRPVYDRQSCETTVPGLYVAGHLTRELHIRSAIRMAPRIVHRIAGATASAQGAWFGADLFVHAAREARRRSPLARTLVRSSSLLRRVVQSIDAANVMREEQSLARHYIRRFPRLRRLLQSFRSYLRAA